MNSMERREARYRRRKAARAARRAAALEGRTELSDACSMGRLAEAAKAAARGVSYKASVQRYMQRRLANACASAEGLERGRDPCRGFVCFNVMERGKLRKIMSVRFSERVVQKALNRNALLPVMERRLIHDNGASRRGRGTSFALRRLVAQLRRHYRHYGSGGYVLQADIRDYFGSIDHEKCKAMVRREMGDCPVARLACRFVDSYREHALREAEGAGEDPESARAAGLGLGSEVNQTLAVAYLDPLDHYVKETLRVKAYGRYNDDFYLVHPDKEFLQECLEGIREKCSSLGLELSEKKTRIAPISKGFTFLKTKVSLTETGKVLRRPCRAAIARERRKLKAQKRLADAGAITARDAALSLASWKGSMKGKSARRSVHNMERLYGELFGRKKDDGNREAER